jgi:hypothetical protein
MPRACVDNYGHQTGTNFVYARGREISNFQCSSKVLQLRLPQLPLSLPLSRQPASSRQLAVLAATRLGIIQGERLLENKSAAVRNPAAIRAKKPRQGHFFRLKTW